MYVTLHFYFRLKLISNENGKLTLANTQGHKVIITAEPLKFEFVNVAGDTVVVINDNHQLLMEPLRVRKEKSDDEDTNIVEVVSVAFVYVIALRCLGNITHFDKYNQSDLCVMLQMSS